MARVFRSGSSVRTGDVDGEIDRLLQLHDACERVLAPLDAEDGGDVAGAARETCRVIEQRLAQLGLTGFSRVLEASANGSS